MSFTRGRLAFRETMGGSVAVDVITNESWGFTSERAVNLHEDDAVALAKWLCEQFGFEVERVPSYEYRVRRDGSQ